ncbi:MAG TPA: SDR family oxidoreductase [Flavisolibacter sp.]|nr:SDR family oxidoreductase [Flavisolibacter sp.]
MDNESFKEEVAIVTGAGDGIGFEIAKSLAKNGASVLLNDINDLAAKNAADIIIAEGGNCFPLPGDASNTEFIKYMVHEAVKHYGKLTIAVANAGLSLYGNFLEYTKEDFQKIVELNLQGSFFLAQSAAKQMIHQKSGGSILFMSSVVGHRALKDLAAYAMTKAGLEMLARNLVIELSQFGISTNAIAPGATLTSRTLGFGDYEKEWSTITPNGRPATVKDIANAALFLLCKKSRHITGQTIVVDGGWTSISVSPADR